MKKLLTIATIAATLSGLSAFGQGYVLWGGGVGSVWTANGAASTRGPAIYDVEFLWAAGSGVTPLVDTAMGMAFSGTNATAAINPATAWTAILNDASFELGVSFNGGTNVFATTGNNGNFSYSVSSFPVLGLSSNGGTMTEYVIAWLAADGATPQLAAAANSPVGWSNPFNYNYTTIIGTPLSITASGFLPFGVGPVPEPTTLALVGLGGLALLAFRRRS